MTSCKLAPPDPIHGMHLQAEEAAEASIPMAPDFLQRVIDSCQTDTTSAHQLMMLAMHAVLLETGMQLAQQVCLICLSAACFNMHTG